MAGIVIFVIVTNIDQYLLTLVHPYPGKAIFCVINVHLGTNGNIPYRRRLSVGRWTVRQHSTKDHTNEEDGKDERQVYQLYYCQKLRFMLARHYSALYMQSCYSSSCL